MLLLNRNYTLTIESDRTVNISAPIPIEFQITKTLENSLPYMNLVIYGLSENDRTIFEKTAIEDKKIKVNFKAGYDNDIVDIFNGYIRLGTNRIVNNIYKTEVDVYDGGFDYFYSVVNKTVLDNSIAISTVIGTMSETTTGFISLSKNLNRPIVLIGNSYEVLKSLIEDNQNLFYTDNIINILDKDLPLLTFIPTISTDTGLISTIESENNEIKITMDLKTKIYLGGSLLLVSETDKKLNGIYKVLQIIIIGNYEDKEWFQIIDCVSI